MSFWTSVRDTVTNPAKSIGDILTSPFVALGDIIEGKNVGSTIEGTVKKDFGSYASGGLVQSAAASSEGRKLLQSETASALSLGLSRDYVGEVDSYKKLSSGGDLDRGNYLSIGRSQTKQFAFGYGGGTLLASGTSLGTAAQYAPAYVLAGQGKYGQAGAAGLGASGLLPAPFQELVDSVFEPAPKSGSPKVTQKGYSSSLPGGDFSNSFGDEGIGIIPIAIALGALYVGVRFLRRKA